MAKRRRLSFPISDRIKVGSRNLARLFLRKSAAHAERKVSHDLEEDLPDAANRAASVDLEEGHPRSLWVGCLQAQ